MEPTSPIPFCPLPQDAPSDTLQMLVVVAVFVIGGGLLARWKKKRRLRRK